MLKRELFLSGEGVCRVSRIVNGNMGLKLWRRPFTITQVQSQTVTVYI